MNSFIYSLLLPSNATYILFKWEVLTVHFTQPRTKSFHSLVILLLLHHHHHHHFSLDRSLLLNKRIQITMLVLRSLRTQLGEKMSLENRNDYVNCRELIIYLSKEGFCFGWYKKWEREFIQRRFMSLEFNPSGL